MQIEHLLLVLVAPLLPGVGGVDVGGVPGSFVKVPLFALLAVPVSDPVLLLQLAGDVAPLGELAGFEDELEQPVLLLGPGTFLCHFI